MVKQTAGRDALGAFAPKFAQLNDDVLFGEVWSREDALSLRDRSLVTVTALIASGIVDSSLQYHLETAKKNGVTKTEIAEALAAQQQLALDKRKIVLDEPIKTAGVYTVRCKLGYEISGELRVEVKEA